MALDTQEQIFNRPDFKRMIRDIELGKVNMVVTKDLSRLGRDLYRNRRIYRKVVSRK